MEIDEMQPVATVTHNSEENRRQQKNFWRCGQHRLSDIQQELACYLMLASQHPQIRAVLMCLNSSGGSRPDRTGPAEVPPALTVGSESESDKDRTPSRRGRRLKNKQEVETSENSPGHRCAASRKHTGLLLRVDDLWRDV